MVAIVGTRKGLFMLKKFLILSTASLISVSCIETQQDHLSQNEGPNEAILSNFGHLESVSKYASSPVFLSTLKKGQPYKICLSEKLVKKYPGFKEEVEAAVNIWAFYIDRKIPLDFIVKKLPAPKSGWKVNDYAKAYKQICGKSDLYMSENVPSGTTLGYTQKSVQYRYGENSERVVTDFARVLNLSNWPEQAGRRFISLEQATKKKRSAAEILQLLKSRNKTVYLPGPSTFLTTTTLVHEFGHVWGMCDQYPLDGNRSNCDPHNSTMSLDGHVMLEEDAVMSSAGWKNKLGLHDDDIDGIIGLAHRGDIAKTGWDYPSKSLYDFTERSEEKGPIRFLKLVDYEFTSDSELTAISAMDITGAFKIIVQKKLVGSKEWEKRGVTYLFSNGVSTRRMKLRMKGIDKNKLKAIRLIYVDRRHHGEINKSDLTATNVSNIIEIKQAPATANNTTTPAAVAAEANSNASLQ